jgi:hypothetical protein
MGILEPKLEIRDGETKELVTRLTVRPGRTYTIGPRTVEKKIKLYWDDNFLEIEWKGSTGELWKALREHVDSRFLRPAFGLPPLRRA